MDCFVAALLAMTGWDFGFNCQTAMRIRVRILAARSARAFVIFTLVKRRGRREDRVRAAPAVSCASCTKENAHEHTGSAETLRPSPRNGFTAYFALSPVTGFLATVIPEKLPSPELDASIGAPGPHDFAVRIARARLPRAPRPPHLTATFVTIATRPSFG
jgi:hypothetical protein